MDIKEPYFSLSTGIQAAKSDAHHDFPAKIYKENLINDELPQEETLLQNKELSHLSEDIFMKKYILKPGLNAEDLKIKKTDDPNDLSKYTNELLNDSLKEYYTVFSYKYPDGKDGSEKSFVQKSLNEIGVTNDVFVICDVVGSWLREDLTKAKRGDNSQVFWWCQTTQTGFDPAGKTSWHTGKDYGFKDNESNFKFCWQLMTKSDKPNKLYTAWDLEKTKTVNQNGEVDYKVGVKDENAMICVNKDLIMTVKAENDRLWDYDAHSSYLMIYDKTTQKFVYADKQMASKENKNFDKNAYKSDFKNFIREMFESLSGGSEEPKLNDYTDRYHMLSKRCGDMPQALNCLDNNLRFQTLLNAEAKPSPENIGIPRNLQTGRIVLDEGESDGRNGIFQTNGNNMFTSYDRIACAQALNYRVPILFYDQEEGCMLFVANYLVTNQKKLENLLIKNEGDDGSITYKYVSENQPDKNAVVYFKKNEIKGIDLIEEQINDLNGKLSTLKEYSEKINDELLQPIISALTKQYSFNDNLFENDSKVRELLRVYTSNLIPLRILSGLQDIFPSDGDIGFNRIINGFNRDFKGITGLTDEVISDNKFQIETFKSGINNIFSTLIENDEVLDEDGKENQSLIMFIDKINAMHTFVLGKINRIECIIQSYSSYNERKKQKEFVVSKNQASYIDVIRPFNPKSVSGRNLDDKLTSYADKLFSIKDIFVEIIKCLGTIHSDNDLFKVSRHFKDKTIEMFQTIKTTPALLSNDVYLRILNEADKKITKLLEVINYDAMQVGGQEKREREREIETIQDYELLNEQSKLVKIITEMYNNNSLSIDNLVKSNDDLVAVLNFDELIIVIFNILTSHYYDVKSFDEEIDEDELFELYNKVGIDYLNITEPYRDKNYDEIEYEYEEEYSGGNNDKIEEFTDEDDMYLYSPFKNQIEISSTKYKNYNAALLLYKALKNIRDIEPLIDKDEDVINEFIDKLGEFIDLLNDIDYETLREIMTEINTRLYKENGVVQEQIAEKEEKRVNRQETPTEEVSEDEMNVDGKTETVVVGTQPLYSPIETPTSASSSDALMEVDKRNDIPSNDNPFATPKSTGGKKTRKRSGKKRSIRRRLINDIKRKNSRRKNKVKSNN